MADQVEEMSKNVNGLLKADEKYLMEIPNTHKFDVISMLKHFDEEVLDVLKTEFGYTPDVSVSNWKIVSGLFLIVFAYISHFHVGPFPGCRGVLFAFSALFAATSLFFQYVSTIQKSSTNLVIKAQQRYVLVSSKSSPLGDTYTVVLSEILGPVAPTTDSIAPYVFGMGRLFDLYRTPADKLATQSVTRPIHESVHQCSCGASVFASEPSH